MRLGALAVVILTACASAPIEKQAGPVTIRVAADSQFSRSDVDKLAALTTEYVQESSRDGRPMSVSIRLGVVPEVPKRDTTGYWSMDPRSGTMNNHPVPLEGGMTPNVGYIPAVSWDTPLAMEQGSHVSITVEYRIVNDAGAVLESHSLGAGTIAEIARIVADRVTQVEAGLRDRS